MSKNSENDHPFDPVKRFFHRKLHILFTISFIFSGCMSWTRQYPLKNEERKLLENGSITITKTTIKRDAFSITKKTYSSNDSNGSSSTSGNEMRDLLSGSFGLIASVVVLPFVVIYDLVTMPIPKGVTYSHAISLPIKITDEENKLIANTYIKIDWEVYRFSHFWRHRLLELETV